MTTRLEKLRSAMTDKGLDAFLTSSPYNRRYLTGFTGTEAYVVVTLHDLFILSDFRYREQIKEQAGSARFVEVKQGQYADPIKQILAEAGSRKAGFEAELMTYAEYRVFADSFGGDIQLAPISGLVEKIRMIKDEDELAVLQEACQLADRTFEHMLGVLKPGMSEREATLKLEGFMAENGAKSPSFDTIMASGVRSAMPHGVASGKIMRKGELITMDFGAYYQGYCSDITRTVFLGKPDEKHKEIYNIVLEAQFAVLDRLKPGMKGTEAHQIAVDVISRHGYGEYFGHGTGHGLGMEIHESPRLNARDDTELAPGMVVTVEPGIYLPDFGGVRIEDDVVITSSGCRRLTVSSKEFIALHG